VQRDTARQVNGLIDGVALLFWPLLAQSGVERLVEWGVPQRHELVERKHTIRPRSDETQCHPEVVTGSEFEDVLVFDPLLP